MPILPPDQRPPEPPEPPPHADLDYRQAPPDLKPTQPTAPVTSAGGGGGGAPPPFAPAGFTDSYMGHMMGGGLPLHALREVFSGAAPPHSGPASSSSSCNTALSSLSSAGGAPMGVRPEPYPQNPAGPPGGMVFTGDKDHRFEYNHSPGEGPPCPLPPHLYNHAMGRPDGPHAQAWGSPSQAVAPPPSLPLPLGYVPHVNSTGAIRGRGLPF